MRDSGAASCSVVPPALGVAVWMMIASLATGSPWAAGEAATDGPPGWLGSSSVPATPLVVITDQRAFPAGSYDGRLESSRTTWPSIVDPAGASAAVNVEFAPSGIWSRTRLPETAATCPGGICCPPTTLRYCPHTIQLASGSGAPVSCSDCA